MIKLSIERYCKVKNEILDFIEKQKHYYPYEEYKYMKFMITTNGVINYTGPMITSLIQILSKFDVIKDESDFYKVFAQMLKDYSLLEGNCCEVACGCYPRLAEIILPTINKNKSSLTIYDPALNIERLGNAKLYKKEFTKDVDINNIDTLIGLFPCEATIPLVKKAIEEDKNLLVAFCDCDHHTEEYPILGNDYWAEDFIMLLRREYGPELQILRWPTEVEQGTPIMFRKSKKMTK